MYWNRLPISYHRRATMKPSKKTIAIDGRGASRVKRTSRQANQRVVYPPRLPRRCFALSLERLLLRRKQLPWPCPTWLANHCRRSSGPPAVTKANPIRDPLFLKSARVRELSEAFAGTSPYETSSKGRSVREQKLAALAVSDHYHDGIEQDLRCDFGIAEFTRSLKVIPGDLNRMLDQYRERLVHTRITRRRRVRSCYVGNMIQRAGTNGSLTLLITHLFRFSYLAASLLVAASGWGSPLVRRVCHLDPVRLPNRFPWASRSSCRVVREQSNTTRAHLLDAAGSR